MRARFYLGRSATGDADTVFKSVTEPTHESHGHLYAAVVGPFRTLRGARFMQVYGRGNPHCRTVSEAEYLGRKYALPTGRMRTAA